MAYKLQIVKRNKTWWAGLGNWDLGPPSAAPPQYLLIVKRGRKKAFCIRGVSDDMGMNHSAILPEAP